MCKIGCSRLNAQRQKNTLLTMNLKCVTSGGQSSLRSNEDLAAPFHLYEEDLKDGKRNDSNRLQTEMRKDLWTSWFIWSKYCLK